MVGTAGKFRPYKYGRVTYELCGESLGVPGRSLQNYPHPLRSFIGSRYKSLWKSSRQNYYAIRERKICFLIYFLSLFCLVLRLAKHFQECKVYIFLNLQIP